MLAGALVLAATLTAGLWPFSFHARNAVAWAEQGGLWFGGTGQVTSNGRFEPPRGRGEPCTLELWVEPARSWDSSALLTFHRGRAASIQVRQSGDDLVFATYGGPERRMRRQVFADHVFRKGQPVLVTLASASGGLEIYVDGALLRSAASLGIGRSDLTGDLIVGNAHSANMSWAGVFRGLALYDRTLAAAEIRDNNRLWRQDRAQLARKSAPAFALYLFDEGQGAVVHNAGRGAPDLLIPERYSVAEPTLLVPFWREFRANRGYAADLAVNVFGLVPLGFCCAALWARRRGPKGCLPVAAIVGFSISLTIELLQAYMPTRSSGTTDLITNTLGAAIGAWAYLRLRGTRLGKPAPAID